MSVRSLLFPGQWLADALADIAVIRSEMFCLLQHNLTSLTPSDVVLVLELAFMEDNCLVLAHISCRPASSRLCRSHADLEKPRIREIVIEEKVTRVEHYKSRGDASTNQLGYRQSLPETRGGPYPLTKLGHYANLVCGRPMSPSRG